MNANDIRDALERMPPRYRFNGREINKLAKRKGSAVRLLAYDRPGVHNCYLIVRVPTEQVTGVPARKLCVGQWEGGWEPGDRDWQEPAADEALEEAIRDAFELDLDGCVETQVRVKPRRSACLSVG